MSFRETLYFDYQASTPVDRRVLEKMLPFFTEKAGNAHASDHAVGWESSRAVSESARQIAALIGADEDEIVFTSGATEANNLALLGMGKGATGRTRRRILVSAIEHKCVLACAQVLESQHGFIVDKIPVDPNGRIKMDAFKALLDDDVLVVSIMAVNNEIGTIQDVPGIASLVRGVGAYFHCDAAQAPIAMDMEELATLTDLLSLSGHKMYGPQGIGALYINRSLQSEIEPLIYGGGQQDGLRSGTVPVPLCVGMGVAATLIRADNTRTMRQEISARRNRFVQGLQTKNAHILLNGPLETERHPGNANLCFRGFEAQGLLNALQPKLAASSGAACTTGVPEPSHVLRAIGLSGEDADASIRFSLGRETTAEQVDAAIELIEQTLRNLG